MAGFAGLVGELFFWSFTGWASYKPEPISPAQNAQPIESRSLDDARLQKFIAAALARDEEHDPPIDV